MVCESASGYSTAPISSCSVLLVFRVSRALVTSQPEWGCPLCRRASSCLPWGNMSSKPPAAVNQHYLKYEVHTNPDFPANCKHVKVRLSVEFPSHVYRMSKRGGKQHVTLSMQSPVQGEWLWPARLSWHSLLLSSQSPLFYEGMDQVAFKQGEQNDERPTEFQWLFYISENNYSLQRKSLIPRWCYTL